MNLVELMREEGFYATERRLTSSSGGGGDEGGKRRAANFGAAAALDLPTLREVGLSPVGFLSLS